MKVLLGRTLLVILLIGLAMPTVYASWAMQFVVYSGNMYEITATQIDVQKIDKKIGQVTSYSSREGTYSGNFSNAYPVGTEYYALKEIDPQQAIAVKTNDGYIWCQYTGEYAGKNAIDKGKLAAGIFVVILFIVRWYSMRQKKRLKL